MYIHVKRMKTIYFMQCDPTETVSKVKQKLFTLSEQPSYKMSTEEVLRGFQIYSGAEGIIHVTVSSCMPMQGE